MVPRMHRCRIMLEHRQCPEALFLGLLMPARDELQGCKVCSDNQVFWPEIIDCKPTLRGPYNTRMGRTVELCLPVISMLTFPQTR